MTNHLTENDQAVLDLIRSKGPLSVGEMVDWLNVTATAVRQRLGRLTGLGMIDRHEFRYGRGRPIHKYTLTQKAHESINDNFADFAKVLWSEVQKIEDDSIRTTVISGVISRLSEQYEKQISGNTVQQRLQAIAQLFSQRGIPFIFDNHDQVPKLKIIGCPYPELSENSSEICELEQKVFSRLAHAPMHVDHCQCESGGKCCSFQPEAVSKKRTNPIL